MCMNCVSQSLPWMAMALGGLQLPRMLARRGGGPSDDPELDAWMAERATLVDGAESPVPDGHGGPGRAAAAPTSRPPRD